MTEETHWGAEAIDPEEHSLPGLKAAFMLHHTRPTGRVLEIGSGDGKNLRTLAAEHRGLELVGCDVKPLRTPADVYTFQLLEGGVLPQAFEGRFDTVLIMDVLEHVPDPEAMLDQAARALTPGGQLVAFVPVEGETVSAYTLFKAVLGRDVYVQTKEHVQSFTHAELRRMIDARFAVHDVRYAYHAVGQTMDAAFFAAQRLKALRDFWWKDNAYYNAEKKAAGGAAGAMNRVLRLANALAWAESTALGRVKATSAGLLVAGAKR